MIARSWRTQISALTMFVLITSAPDLGAQGETTRVGPVAGAGSNQHSDTTDLNECENQEITWECLRETLVAELKAGVAKAEEYPKIWYEDDGPLMGVVYLECLGKTEEEHGLKRLQWDKRKTWTIGLLKEGDEKYRMVKAEESVEWRSPAGDWRVRKGRSRYVQPSSLGRVFTGKPKPY